MRFLTSYILYSSGTWCQILQCVQDIESHCLIKIELCNCMPMSNFGISIQCPNPMLSNTSVSIGKQFRLQNIYIAKMVMFKLLNSYVFSKIQMYAIHSQHCVASRFGIGVQVFSIQAQQRNQTLQRFISMHALDILSLSKQCSIDTNGQLGLGTLIESIWSLHLADSHSKKLIIRDICSLDHRPMAAPYIQA